jgi:hypothetical protein
VVAVQRDARGGKKILAVGKEAKEMLGRTPGTITAIRPIKDGVIADFEITEAMLRYFIERAHNRRTMVKPRIIICVPYGITEVEKRAVKEAGFFGFDYHISLLRRMPQWIAEARALGLTTNSWTINKEEDMSWLLELGVDFITTDEPEKLATLVPSKK